MAEIPKIPQTQLSKANASVILKGFGLQVIKPEFFNFKTQPTDSPVATSYLGTPVFSNLIFHAGSYEYKGKTINYPELTIETVLIDVNMEKLINATPLQGRDGTVKEYVSDGDYEISIRGAIVSKYANQYPKEDMDKLIQLIKVKQALNVSSRFLQMFSIHSLVIRAHSFGEREGYNNEQLFMLTCLSDEPLELKLRNAEA
jgi:hypothetical protein